ncbi:(d)CMP kinase [bacterium]|nr:MAG: (d)CMP kinase [bacterium]
MTGAAVPVLTIDGPSGSGKGTISRRVADRLGWELLDSGALYRLVAVGAGRAGLPEDDVAAHAAFARSMQVRFSVGPAGEEQIWLAGEEVTNLVRSEAAGNGASRVAALEPVRGALLQRQRDFARPPGLVADGRDMGTVVFPAAQLKIFLTASAEERARRRHNQLKDKGSGVSLAALSREIAERDERDMRRSTAPLKPAEDALVVDSTALDIDQVVAQVMRLAAERGLLASR